MNLTQLKYFVAIARNRSFSRASTELHVAQPALTRHIKGLEAELDGALFLRHQKGVELTVLGKSLLERAEYQLQSFEQMREDIVERAVAPSGALRIGCPPALTKPLVVKPVQTLLKTYPKISIEVREGISDQLAREVFTDALDIAIASLVSAPPHLSAEKLFKEEIFLFGSRSASFPERITAKFLHSVPLLLPRRGNAIRDLLNSYMSRSGLALTPIVETDSTQLIEQLIDQGIGYAVVPRLSLAAKLGRSKLRGMAIPGLHVERCLIRRKDLPETRAVREFARLVRSVIGNAAGP